MENPFKREDKPKSDQKRVSRSDTPTNERPRVTPYRWPDEFDGSATVPPGRSKRTKGEWMRR